MGLFGLERISMVYKEILDRSMFERISTLVLVAPDPDALASAKLLTNLLRNDSVLYRMIPVLGPPSFKKVNEDHVRDQTDLKTIILINCGGNVNLTEQFDLASSIRVYVFDCHRPFKLSNIFNNPQVRVIGEDKNINDKLAAAYRAVAFKEIDFDCDLDGNERPHDPAEDLPDDDPVKNIQLKQVFKKWRSKILMESRTLVDQYQHSDIFYGAPTSYLLFILTKSQGDLKNDYFWWSILGLTYHYINNHLSSKEYTNIFTYLRTKLNQHNLIKYPKKKRSNNTSFNNNNNNNNVNLKTLRGRHMAKMSERSPFNSYSQSQGSISLSPNTSFVDGETAIRGLKSNLPPKETEEYKFNKLEIEGKVEETECFRFRTLHYWSLYEAMFYSDYVATKFAVWKKVGRNKLHNLLAKMGVSLKQATLPYSHMSTDIKDSLMSELISLGPSYGLTELTFPSFLRNMGYNTILPLQASDAVCSLEALLKLTPRMIVGLLESNANPHMQKVYSKHRDLPCRIDDKICKDALDTLTNAYGSVGDHEDFSLYLDEVSNNAFFAAYDALDDIKLLKAGLELSKYIQKGTMEEALKILETDGLKRFKSYRLAFIKESKLTYSPKTLIDIGNFLMMAIKQVWQDDEENNLHLPMLTVGFDSLSEQFTVVGVKHKRSSSEDSFACAFHHQATKLNLHLGLNWFDNGIIMLYREQLASFLASLVIRN